MDQDGRAYALNAIGHSFASLVADLIDFNATKVPKDIEMWASQPPNPWLINSQNL